MDRPRTCKTDFEYNGKGRRDVGRPRKRWALCDVGTGKEPNPITEKLDSYRRCWGENLLRMDRTKISKITFEHNAKGRRDVGRPRKRWPRGSATRIAQEEKTTDKNAST